MAHLHRQQPLGRRRPRDQRLHLDRAQLPCRDPKVLAGLLFEIAHVVVRFDHVFGIAKANHSIMRAMMHRVADRLLVA